MSISEMFFFKIEYIYIYAMQQRLYWSFQVNRISFRELLMTSLDTWLKMMSPRSLDDFPTKRLEDYVHLRALPAGWSWFQWFLLGGASHSVNVSKKSSHINGMSLLTYGIIWDMYIYNQLYTYIHGYVIYGNMDIYIYIMYIYIYELSRMIIYVLTYMGFSWP